MCQAMQPQSCWTVATFDHLGLRKNRTGCAKSSRDCVVWIIVKNVIREVHCIGLDERIVRALDVSAARIEDDEIAASCGASAVSYLAIEILGQLVGPSCARGGPYSV